MDIIEQDGLLPFLGRAICWGQCRQDIVEGFRRSNRTISHATILCTAHSICGFLLQECQNFGIPVPKACEMLKSIGTVSVAKDIELSAIARMIRLYREMCHGQAVQKDCLGKLAGIILSLLLGGCVDGTVMKELAELHETCPKFVAKCTAQIFRFNFSDARVAGALHSGLLATTLSIECQGIPNNFSGDAVRAGALAPGIIDRLYKIRLHRKTSKILGSMTILNYRGLEDKLEHMLRDTHEYVCANCLRTFDKKALKWCKGTHMLEPFCSMECLRESWDAGVCADFGDIAEEDDDKRSISLKRNILQAGYKVLQECIVRIKCDHSQGMARGQGLTIAINLIEFPPRVSSGLLPPGDPSDCAQVRFIADDFRGFRDGVGGRVLVLRKRLAI
ncbi:hypothetical protein THAOC_09049 [Thalassiosira oceanica]|uniref:Uncharacterized protein n=1 Tax=Thalassiosira oceanica TaxID=159749 RepID=K0T8L1_THAOC|nr:hypothetical protein THAOC_09049 [Thalassiosira oceanica]|eukprot:EJK69666.1 hypothetical protein THAOC_09049 [Thalassiosira oceanica]